MKEKKLVTLLYQLLKMNSLVTFIDSKNRKTNIQFMFPGELNNNEGPDLQNAKFVINKNIISGDIEFHINSLDWIKHHHNLDSRYNNVKLHIVFNMNSKFRIENTNHQRIKTVSLKNYQKLFNNIKTYEYKYENLYTSLPCYYLTKREKNRYIINDILKFLGLKNIVSKIRRYKKYLSIYLKEYNEIDAYNQVIYLSLLRSFGYEKNKLIFEDFGKRVNYKRIKRLLLQDKRESILRYLLKNIKKSRNRPCNSPLKRLSQLLNFLQHIESPIKYIAGIIFKKKSFKGIAEKLRKKVNLDGEFKIGKQRIKIIIYNAILPVVYLYAEYKNRVKLKNYIFKYWYNEINFEENHIIRKMKKILSYNQNYKDLEIEREGLMFLYNNYCKYKRCETCPIYKKLK